MQRHFFLSMTFALLTSPLAAQSWTEIASYGAYIGPEDMWNSSGQPVRNLGGVIQQDRANYHRFGIRHAQDDNDPVFSDPAMRARIPEMVAAGQGDRGFFATWARNGQPFQVLVFVCGYGATPSLVYLAGPGEDFSGCV